jgi:hypothetical protein
MIVQAWEHEGFEFFNMKRLLKSIWKSDEKLGAKIISKSNSNVSSLMMRKIINIKILTR